MDLRWWPWRRRPPSDPGKHPTVGCWGRIERCRHAHVRRRRTRDLGTAAMRMECLRVARPCAGRPRNRARQAQCRCLQCAHQDADALRGEGAGQCWAVLGSARGRLARNCVGFAGASRAVAQTEARDTGFAPPRLCMSLPPPPPPPYHDDSRPPAHAPSPHGNGINDYHHGNNHQHNHDKIIVSIELVCGGISTSLL